MMIGASVRWSRGVLLVLGVASVLALFVGLRPDRVVAQSDEIQKYIDEWLVTYQPQIEAGQSDYLKTYGHYWQGLATHSEAAKPEYDLADKLVLIDEKSFAADNLAVKPTDQLAEPSWDQLFPDIVSKLPTSLRVDVYQGVEGWGYVIHLDYCVGVECFQRSINVGSEVWRSVYWHPLEGSNTK